MKKIKATAILLGILTIIKNVILLITPFFIYNILNENYDFAVAVLGVLLYFSLINYLEL